MRDSTIMHSLPIHALHATWPLSLCVGDIRSMDTCGIDRQSNADAKSEHIIDC
jgi:hypothetical protein